MSERESINLRDLFVPVALPKPTHCSTFSYEMLKGHSEHFTKLNSFFVADGLLSTYHCSIDGRTYTVKVTTSQP